MVSHNQLHDSELSVASQKCPVNVGNILMNFEDWDVKYVACFEIFF